MLQLGSMHAEERVAAFLLNLMHRLQARGFSASSVLLRMSREEIGSFLGLQLETVSRTLVQVPGQRPARRAPAPDRDDRSGRPAAPARRRSGELDVLRRHLDRAARAFGDADSAMCGNRQSAEVAAFQTRDACPIHWPTRPAKHLCPTSDSRVDRLAAAHRSAAPARPRRIAPPRVSTYAGRPPDARARSISSSSRKVPCSDVPPARKAACPSVSPTTNSSTSTIAS